MPDHRTTSHRRQARTADWDEIVRRLEAARTAVWHGWAPSPEERARVLKARARALAREPAPETAAEAVTVVEFRLAHETYGVESSYVRGVYSLKEWTPLPGLPPFVPGIVNVRGQLLPAIDLKKFFDLPDKGPTGLGTVIILHDDHTEFGLLADAVLGVRAIPRKEVQPPVPTPTGAREAYLKGVTGEPVVLLDAQRLLSDRKLVVHEEGEA